MKNRGTALCAMALLTAMSAAQAQMSHDTMPMDGLMWHADPWMVMAHGFANFVYDHQGGPRGDTKSFASSMAMVIGTRPLGPGTLALRAMVSLDPTMGRGGYPLLLQT